MSINRGPSVQMTVKSYDFNFDTFEVEVRQCEEWAKFSKSEPVRSLVPAILLPALTGEYGEPYEFVDRTFEVVMP